MKQVLGDPSTCPESALTVEEANNPAGRSAAQTPAVGWQLDHSANCCKSADSQTNITKYNVL